MPEAIDMTGRKFGRLMVLERAPNRAKHVCWECVCDCGNVLAVQGQYLRTGRTKSCGCLQRELVALRNITHNMSDHPLFQVWSDMLKRCTNQKCAAYPNYGGRGITVCDRWLDSPANFIEDMGPRPDGYSIDRIDVNGNYEPDNCEWASDEQQIRNRRITVYLTYEGETLTMAEWSEKTGIPYGRLQARRAAGLSDVDIITLPKGFRRPRADAA